MLVCHYFHIGIVKCHVPYIGTLVPFIVPCRMQNHNCVLIVSSDLVHKYMTSAR